MKIPCCFFPPCWDDDDDDMYLPSFFDVFIMLLSADSCDKHIRYDNRSDTSLVVDEDIFKSTQYYISAYDKFMPNGAYIYRVTAYASH